MARPGAAPALSTIPLQRGILYGPVLSRRLGRSLGLNILPEEIKVCSMDCAYCQYSWTGMLSADPRQVGTFLPSRESVRGALLAELRRLRRAGTPPDTLTFSGNGEATLHPDFAGIAADVVALRDEYAAACRTAILSNATTLGRADVREGLLLLDDPILKLDAGTEDTFRRLNRPARGIRFDHVLEGLRALGPRIILQSMFVGGRVDNASDSEIGAWIAAVGAIRPRLVQVYTLDRGPADGGLVPVAAERLREIASELQARAGVVAKLYL
jgi:wyosine [tRNA(Phe)-imidazoG37] synthetase (radical SAM superfamily)